MSCCDDLLQDLISGNQKIASKGIKWDDAVIWGLAGAVSAILSGGTSIALATGANATAGFIGQNKDIISSIAEGTLDIKTLQDKKPMSPEEWMSVLLTANLNGLYVGKGTDDPTPYLDINAERTWDEFWNLDSPNLLRDRWLEDNAEDINSWSPLRYTIGTDGVSVSPKPYAPEDLEYWSRDNRRNEMPFYVEEDIGIAYRDFLFGSLGKYIGISPSDLGTEYESYYLQTLETMRFLMDDPEEINAFIQQYGENGEERGLAFDILRLDPNLLTLIQGSIEPGNTPSGFELGNFAQFATEGSNLGILSGQDPIFNSILQSLVDNEGITKEFLVNNLLSTEDGEGSYLFDQAVQRSINRSMGLDPETGLNPLAVTEDRILNPEEFGELHPDETFIAPSLGKIAGIIEDFNTLKSDLSSVRETADGVQRAVVGAKLEAGMAYRKAIEAKDLAQKALGKANSNSTQSAEEQSNEETPSHVGGGQRII